MSSDKSAQNKRCEPRFLPAFEQVGWRKVGDKQLETGELIDVSRTGLSFRIPTNGGAKLAPGDEISIRHLGHDNRPAQYSVVWEHDGDESLSVGCTRLSATAIVPKPRPSSFNLVVARLQRNVTGRISPTVQRAETVTVGTKVTEGQNAR